MAKKRALAFAGGALLACFLAWIAGFDFDHRGADSFGFAMGAIIVGLVASLYPFEDTP